MIDSSGLLGSIVSFEPTVLTSAVFESSIAECIRVRRVRSSLLTITDSMKRVPKRAAAKITIEIMAKLKIRDQLILTAPIAAHAATKVNANRFMTARRVANQLLRTPVTT